MTSAAKQNVVASDVELDRKKIVGRSRKAMVFGGTFGGTPIAIKRVMTLDLHPQWGKKTTIECYDKISTLHHPNVLKIIGIYEDENFR